MSETDKAAIQIVEKLQGRIQKWVIAMVGIFAIALLTGVFWGGATNNQVKNNTQTGTTNSQDIKDLTKAINDYFSDQRVENTKHVTREEFKKAEDYWDATDDNLDLILYWARSRGFTGEFRSAENGDTNRN
jgi:hypothetical protein